MAVALAALFVALGGTSYAAFALAPNSVGTAQLQNRAVTAPKVAFHTLTGNQINLSKLGTVPSANSANSASALDSLAFERLQYTDPPGLPASAEIPCPQGDLAVSGGVENSDTQADVVQSAPYNSTTGFAAGGRPDQWWFETFNHDTSAPDNVVVWAICVPARSWQDY